MSWGKTEQRPVSIWGIGKSSLIEFVVVEIVYLIEFYYRVKLGENYEADRYLMKSQQWNQRCNEWQRSILAVAVKYQNRIGNGLKWMLCIAVFKFFSHSHHREIFTGHFFSPSIGPVQLPYSSGPSPSVKNLLWRILSTHKRRENCIINHCEPTSQLQ